MRLPSQGLVPAGEIAFSFDEHPVSARAGETIAAALSAAGLVALSGRPDGTMRGLWCGMGACFECVVTVNGRARQRACMVKAEAGMHVRSAALPETMPAAPMPGHALQEHVVDVAVVGAGPAGLTAAQHLAALGLDVLVMDERPQPGGQYFKPIAASFTQTVATDRQFAAGQRLRQATVAAGALLWQDCTVWAAFAPDELGVLRGGCAMIVRPRRLLLATGAYERPVPIPGWTLPGVMTTGAAQTLARSYRVLPGRRVVIGGNGPLNLQLAVELVRAGVKVVAVAEEARRPGRAMAGLAVQAAAAAPGLLAAGLRMLGVLRRAGVEVVWGGQVTAAHGMDRVTACTLRTGAGDRRLDCDVLALGHGFIPSTELARQLGCRHVFVDRHVGFLATATAADGRTSLPTAWAIGDGAEPGGAAIAMQRGTLAADAIARDLGRPGLPEAAIARAQRRLARASRFQQALWRIFAAETFDVASVSDDAVVCRCEGITAGRLRHVLTGHGADAGTAKRLTRVGMGSCQGRNCAAVLARLVARAGGAAPGAFSFFAPRAPVKPVPLAAVAMEKPEWGGHRRSVPPATVLRPGRPRPRWADPCRTDVLVIGAGVVGACVAGSLAHDGVEVLVVDRDSPGQQASTANAGSLHVQLLSFDFGVKAEAGGGPAAETLRLGPGAIALWQEIAAESGADLGLEITGGLMLAETPGQLAFLRDKAALEARYGVHTEVIGANELRMLEPALAPEMVGAAYCAAEGKIDPLLATFAAIDSARRAGAVFETDAPVLSIERTGGLREAGSFLVHTSAGTVRAARIVNCAGAWSPLISAMISGPIPVAGAPLQMMVTEPGPKLIGRLIGHADRHLSLKQTAAGALLIGGGWSAGLDADTGASRALRWAMEGNAFVACRVLPGAGAFNLLRVWAGMNINIDGAPILGEMPGVPGFWNCVTSNGFTLAPMVAAMTTDAMRNGRSASLAPFTLDRF